MTKLERAQELIGKTMVIINLKSQDYRTEFHVTGVDVVAYDDIMFNWSWKNKRYLCLVGDYTQIRDGKVIETETGAAIVYKDKFAYDFV